MTQREARRKVENDLRNYPYWLLAENAAGLGSPTRWDIVTSKSLNNSVVENIAIKNEEINNKVMLIEGVLDLLDNRSKAIIERKYFTEKEQFDLDGILKEYAITKNTYYTVVNKSLDKFAVALRYC